MKSNVNNLIIILLIVSSAFVYADDEKDTVKGTSASRFLFEQNFLENNISKVDYNDGWGGFYSYAPNIGFSIGKRIIYNGHIQLLDNVIPNSALAVLSENELRLLRNTIFAKYGIIFESNELTAHFRQFNWYNPRNNNVDAVLKDVDNMNIENIRIFEYARSNRNLNKRDLIGFWGTSTDAWKGNEIMIFENNNIIADLQEENRSFDWNWKGSYRVENGLLVVLVNEQYVGTPDYLKNINWNWPEGVLYRDGTVHYREPIRMVFPLTKSDWGDGYLLFGSINYAHRITSFYNHNFSKLETDLILSMRSRAINLAIESQRNRNTEFEEISIINSNTTRNGDIINIVNNYRVIMRGTIIGLIGHHVDVTVIGQLNLLNNSMSIISANIR